MDGDTWRFQNASGYGVRMYVQSPVARARRRTCREGQYRGIPGAKDHDLCSLERKVAERVDTGLDNKAKALLARLSFFITYGRYPVMKSMSEKRPSVPIGERVLWCRWILEDRKALTRQGISYFGLSRKNRPPVGAPEVAKRRAMPVTIVVGPGCDHETICAYHQRCYPTGWQYGYPGG